MVVTYVSIQNKNTMEMLASRKNIKPKVFEDLGNIIQKFPCSDVVSHYLEDFVSIDFVIHNFQSPRLSKTLSDTTAIDCNISVCAAATCVVVISMVFLIIAVIEMRKFELNSCFDFFSLHY